MLSLECKTDVASFAWEPMGRRFAMCEGDGPRFDVGIYAIDNEAGEVTQLTKMNNKPVNALFWSPRGGHIVLAGLGSLNGQLEFYNVKELDTMGRDEHFMCTDVAWDPTGRFVSTVVSEFQCERQCLVVHGSW